MSTGFGALFWIWFLTLSGRESGPLLESDEPGSLFPSLERAGKAA